MVRTSPRHTRRPAVLRMPETGYTIVEVIIAMIVGVLVLSAAIAFLITQMRTLEGSDVRENVSRNGRYIGVALRRDAQAAGVELKSSTDFGAVAVHTGSPGDTLVMLHVPYLPEPAPPHDLVPPSGTDNPLPSGGTCGTRCIEITKESGVPVDLEVGDLARLQVAQERRLILIEQLAAKTDTSVTIQWTDADTILHRPAGLVDDLRLDRYSTFVQRLRPILYYMDDQGHLYRSVKLDLTGKPEADILAFGLEGFDVKLSFADGDVLEEANPFDADNSNDYDDIVSIIARTTVKADRVDPRINQGELIKKTYEWEIAPRNLRYEKNRK